MKVSMKTLTGPGMNTSMGLVTMIRGFWLGNDQIHSLTKSGNMKLRVELEAWDGRTAFAEYDTFRLFLKLVN